MFFILLCSVFNQITSTYNGFNVFAFVELRARAPAWRRGENDNGTFAEHIFLRFRITFCYFNVISSVASRTIIIIIICEKIGWKFSSVFFFFFSTRRPVSFSLVGCSARMALFLFVARCGTIIWPVLWFWMLFVRLLFRSHNFCCHNMGCLCIVCIARKS